MEYKVVIRYEGFVNFVIDAESETEAKRKAEKEFNNMSDSSIIDNLSVVEISDCQKIWTEG